MAEVNSSHVITTEAVEVPTVRGRRPKVRASSAMRDVLESQDGFLARVIELLSHHERMALRLRHRDGMDAGAIAARMSLPQSIVDDLLVSAESTVRAAQRAFIAALVESAGAST
jgi:DNA-directed RNA polymerase specialized sigma24 family protein